MAKRGQNLDVKVKIGPSADERHDHDPPILRRKRINGNRRPMRSVSLHHHSTLSYQDGYALPEAHVRRATELQMGALAMTEHGNADSHVQLEIAAQEQGVKPIYGVEFYTGPVGEKAQQRKFHLTVLAKNAEGYRNLLKLVSLSYDEGFYYEPTVSWEMLKRYRRGLVVLSGCQGSLLFCSAVGGKTIAAEDASEARALRVARAFKKVFGGDYYVEVQAFPELASSCHANPILARVAKKAGIRLVGTMDCHYTTYDEREVQKILHNLRGGARKTLEEQEQEWGYDVPLAPPLSDAAFYRRLKLTGLTKEQAIQAMVSTEDIAQGCTVELPRLPMTTFPLPGGFEDAQAYWDHQIRAGWRERGCHKLPKAEAARYRAQLMKEKPIFEQKGFIDYMLIVQDGVQYVKNQGWFVGPGRGSAAASIICWLLRITEVNPMSFDNLVFERFIDVTREDLPDIDLDFPSEARPVLRSYLVAKYGEGCVSNIGTFTYFKGKLALDDVARVFRVPKFEIDTIKGFLVERMSGDLRASATIEDTAEQFEEAGAVFAKYPDLRKSQLLEGNIKGFGVHAAGLVLSNHPIEDSGVCTIKRREVPKGSGNIVEVVSLDKFDAERQGLVKMDFLGLSTASVIQFCLGEIGMTVQEAYDVDLTDEVTLKAFYDNDVAGIFQFDGRACRYVNSNLKPQNFAEVCDVTALGRPGALHNGSAINYCEVKWGRKTPEKVHPAIDSILEATRYQIVYQEQILRICREVGNFPWEKTAEIRKIIAKKEGNAAFNRKRDQFMAGALTVHERQDVPPMMEAVADGVWSKMITAGSYGFNAAHAYAYGWLSFFTQWLKQHHPGPFYAASLRYAPNPEKHRDLLRDAVRHGVDVRPPAPSTAPQSWVAGQQNGRVTLQAGLSQIHGIGTVVANKMLAAREDAPDADWSTWSAYAARVKGIGPKTAERIVEWCAQDDPFDAFTTDKRIKAVRDESRAGELKPVPAVTHTAESLPTEEVRSLRVVMAMVVRVRNIRDLFENHMSAKGIALDPDTVKDPHLREYAVLRCDDDTDDLAVRIDRWKYPAMRDAIFGCRIGIDILVVEGVLNTYAGKVIDAQRIWVIDPE